MTTNEAHSVGVFDDLQKAERTIDELRRHGFDQEEIGIIGNVDEEKEIPTPMAMKSPEWNVTRGVSAGGIYGAIIGGMVALVTPGLANVAGWGQWFEITFGAILGAAMGGFLLAFGGLFLSRLQGRFYEGELEKGRFIVTVKNRARLQEALNLLNRRAVHSGVDSTNRGP
jgi:hypothetical protein